MDQDQDGFHSPFYHTPKWLDIELELYPQTTMTKRFVLQNSNDGLFQEFYAEVTYLSKTREIDITRALTRAIRKNYQQHHVTQNWPNFPQHHKNPFLNIGNPNKNNYYEFQKSPIYFQSILKNKFRILYYDEYSQNFYSIGQYPFDEKPILLGEQFLEMDLITIKLEPCGQYQIYNSHFQGYSHAPLYNQTAFSISENKKYTENFPYKEQEKQANYGPYQSISNDEQWVISSYTSNENSGNGKERSIKQVLEKLGEWRRIYHQNKKTSLEESAKEIKIPKRTLDDYYLQVKLAEKYGFNFEKNANQGMGTLRKFVKENHNCEKKKDEPLKILAKFKNNK